jgi:UDP-3-O-[3-hydroxymyristoyl] glucosamine N-acyltransferase
MIRKTLSEIAEIVGGEVVGDKNLVITGLSGIQQAQDGDLTFITNLKYIALSKTTKASAIVTPRDIQILGKNLIRADNPSLAFARIASAMTDEDACHPKGIHRSAVIAEDACIGENVAVGPCAIIESKADIGDHTVIYGGCYIGHHSRLGKGCLVYPNVTIRERITVGNRVIIHSGAVVGSDGFGFVQVDGRHEKIPQIGTVVIEDDVEIGANVTIDRARFDKTIIGEGTKIDNLVQIAHNVIVGKHCIIISQAGISGSTKIGDGAILAGQAGIHGHLTVGAGAMIASKTGVTKSIPAYTKVSGFPAQPYMKEQRFQVALRQVPASLKTIQELKKRIEQLEKKLNHG